MLRCLLLRRERVEAGRKPPSAVEIENDDADEGHADVQLKPFAASAGLIIECRELSRRSDVIITLAAIGTVLVLCAVVYSSLSSEN